MKTLIRQQSLFFFLILSLLCIIYFPQLTGDFIGDDVGRIVDTPIDTFFSGLYKMLGDRPLLVASMWIDRVVFGFNEFGMKLENLIIVSLIFVLTRITIDEMGKYFLQPVNPLFRDALLLLFAIHPLNTQAFGHVIQRGALFATLFGLISTILLIRSEGDFKKISWKLALLTWCLALMAKPNIAFLPLWWAVILFIGGNKNRIKYLAAFLIMLFIPVAGYMLGGYNPQKSADAISNWEYFLTQGRVLLVYFKLLIWPDPLYFIYYFVDSKPDELFPGLFLWVAYVSAFVLILVKSPNKPFKVFVIGCFLAFLPESSFFRIIHVIFEHRTFTPFLFLISSLAFINIKVSKKLLVFLLTPIFLAFCYLTFSRSVVAKSYTTWALHDLSQGGCFIPYNVFYVGHQFLRKGDVEGARKALKMTDNCQGHPFVAATLGAEIELTEAKEFSQAIFDKFKNVLHSENQVACVVRNQANYFFIQKIIKYQDIVSSCVTEELLSHQLKFILKFPVECEASIEFYVLANNGCMSELLKNPADNKYKILKLRTIRYVYFNSNDSSLEMDLESAIEKPEVQYLKSLYNKRKLKK